MLLALGTQDIIQMNITIMLLKLKILFVTKITAGTVSIAKVSQSLLPVEHGLDF